MIRWLKSLFVQRRVINVKVRGRWIFLHYSNGDVEVYRPETNQR